MLVDMHLHALPNSTDSFLTLEEIVSLAKGRGLDAICLTDHDTMGGREFAAEYSKKIGFPIFVGVEYYSLWGDITAWGIDSFPDKRIEAQTFLDQVNAAGGFCVSAHPFRNNNRGFDEVSQFLPTPPPSAHPPLTHLLPSASERMPPPHKH